MKYRIIVKVNDKGIIYYRPEFKAGLIFWETLHRPFSVIINKYDIEEVTNQILDHYKLTRKRALFKNKPAIQVILTPKRMDNVELDKDTPRRIENIDFAPITIEY